MAKSTAERFHVLQARPKITGVRVGKIVGMSNTGVPLVDYPGNPFGPATPRTTTSISARLLRQAFEKRMEVLLAFENNDPARPVLFDFLEGGKVRQLKVERTPSREENPSAESPSRVGGAQLGRIVAVRDGIVFVDFDGNSMGPRPARTTVPLRNLKDEVLLVLSVGNDPVIVGQIYTTIPFAEAGGEDSELVLKGQRVRIEAEAELVLVAGRSKIHLDAGGKAVTTADQVVSRAQGANKVQGGSVQLN
jgi:hypothetical protein